MEIAFICTNYNNSNLTIDCIESLLQNKDINFKFFVVDNDSSEDQKNILLHEYQQNTNVKLIMSYENIGYFGGLNLGLKESLKEDFDLRIFGNNDLIFNSSLKRELLSTKNLWNKYPIISPYIETLDGHPQNPHVVKRIGLAREIIYSIYHANYFLSKIILRLSKLTRRLTKRKDEENNFDKEMEIWQGYGACYIMTNLFLDQVSTELWSPTFLMFEEFFLSHQINQKGYNIIYTPRINVKHITHATMGNVPSKQKWKFSQESFKIYRKHVKLKL